MENFLQPQDLSEAVKLELAVNKITNENIYFLNSVIGRYEGLLNLVWHAEVPAQKIFDHYGNNAYKMFEEAKKIEDFIKSYKADYQISVSIGEYVINEDGTVTVTKEADKGLSPAEYL